MALNRRGYTLIEMVIYIGLFAVAMVTIGSVYILSSRTQKQVYADALVSGRTGSALDVIRKDLQTTALASITAYPNKTSSTEAPGLSMAGAYDDKRNFVINDYGAPQWDSTVFYTVKKTNAKTGTLYRWQEDVSDKDKLPQLPQLSSMLPSALKDNSHALLENVLLSNLTIDGVGEGGKFDTGDGGGFEVMFVRREGGEDGTESLTAENPRTQPANGNTRLVQVTLKILRDEGSSPPTLFTQTIRVTPRH
ncbi:MAG: type II secretion system protein J [Vulcanimicrobiota bacterium]